VKAKHPVSNLNEFSVIHMGKSHLSAWTEPKKNEPLPVLIAYSDAARIRIWFCYSVRVLFDSCLCLQVLHTDFMNTVFDLLVLACRILTENWCSFGLYFASWCYVVEEFTRFMSLMSHLFTVPVSMPVCTSFAYPLFCQRQ